MKRSTIFGAIVAVMLVSVLLWSRRGQNTGTQGAPEATSQTSPVTITAAPSNEPPTATPPGYTPEDIEVAKLIRGSEQDRLVRAFNETANVPLAFYGQVVDQDTNPLENVRVGVVVWEDYERPSIQLISTATNFQRLTGFDGRFEVMGLKGHRVGIMELTKDGYEPEQGISDAYGEFAALSGSFTDPVVFRMWATNIHERLISGDKEIKIVPDGRHYGIDLTKGTAGEGDGGDLVVWIKRPEWVEFPQRFFWSCGLAAPGGGLEPEANRGLPMYRAPIGDYTNIFNLYVEHDTHAREGKSLDNHFYFKLRNGLYGRVSASFWTTFHYWAPTYRKDPAFGQIHLSYAINPSGSRLLR